MKVQYTLLEALAYEAFAACESTLNHQEEVSAEHLQTALGDILDRYGVHHDLKPNPYSMRLRSLAQSIGSETFKNRGKTLMSERNYLYTVRIGPKLEKVTRTRSFVEAMTLVLDTILKTPLEYCPNITLTISGDEGFSLIIKSGDMT